MKENILKQRFELFSVRSVFEELEISLKDVTLRDRPDFSFIFEGSNIGLEETKCSFNEKAFKTESRLLFLLKEYRKELEAKGRYGIEVSFLLKEEIYNKNKISWDIFKSEIEKLCEGEIFETEYIDEAIIESVPTETIKVRMYSGREPQKLTFTHIREIILKKEEKLKEYKLLDSNKNINEYWLAINICENSFSYKDFVLDNIDSEYNRIYLVSSHEELRRIK